MKSKVTVRTQIVSPAQAKLWLHPEVNEGNRCISQHAVDGYAAEMKAGRWIVGPDAIAFDTNGKLRNGQHRLSAIVQSGVACEFSIMENVDEEDGRVFDQGRARSVPDMLKMFYGQKRAGLVTGSVHMLDLFVHDRKVKQTVGHVVEMINIYSAGIEWAVECIPGRSHFSQSAVVAPLIYAHKTSPTVVESFTRRMCSGADLGLTSPVLLMRNHVLTEGTLHGNDQKLKTFKMVLTAIDKVMRGQTCKSLRYRDDIIEEFASAYASGRQKKFA